MMTTFNVLFDVKNRVESKSVKLIPVLKLKSFISNRSKNELMDKYNNFIFCFCYYCIA